MEPPLALALLAFSSAGLAGHVGLLEATRNGEVPGPDGFIEGVKRHTLTFFAAKVAIAALVYLTAQDIRNRMMWQSELWLPFALPSLVLAPIVGAASMKPGRPIARNRLAGAARSA